MSTLLSTLPIPIPILLPLLALTLLILRPLLKNLTSPLRAIPPAHPLAPYTSLWIHSIRHRSIENATLKAAHAKHGPIIRLSPKEISVNCVKGGIRDVYAGGMEKSDPLSGYNWYGFFKNYGGIDNMFSLGRNKPHSTRKRIISNLYSKSVVTTSPALLAQMSNILYSRFLPYLSSTLDTPQVKGQAPGVLNVYALLSASTMDIVTGYIFGLASGSNLIQNREQVSWFLDLYNSRRSYNFWWQELPGFSAFMLKWFGYRMAPKWVDDANAEIEKWTVGMCEGAAKVVEQSSSSSSSSSSGVEIENTPVVYQQLTAALAKEAKKAERGDTDVKLDLASEVLDHLAAGFDTSGITLNYIVHELSVNPDIQSRLQEELRTLSPQLVPASAPALPDPKAVDALPLLHAVVWETLRLHSAIPGPQPRFTPAQGCRLGPEEQSYFIPGGVRVSASAGLLHLNEDVYENAEQWRPDRWLENVSEDKRKDMESRWFWAFGSGGRMCVGSHLAVYQMKYLIAALYANYTTTIVDDTGIEQSDSYTAPPKSEKLLIKLDKHVKTG